MTDDLFDRQINDSFHGTGKRRTELSGLFLVRVDKLFREFGYRAVTAWEDGDAIVVCVEKPDDTGVWQSIMSIHIAEVQADMAASIREFVQDYIDFDLHGGEIPMWSADELARLLVLCETQQPDTVLFLKSEYGKFWRTPAVEIGWWLEHGTLEHNFTYIQSIERVQDCLVIVHKEQRRRWQLGDPVIESYRSNLPVNDEPLPAPGSKTRLQ